MHEQPRSAVVLTRQKLYEKVWTTPMTKLAKDYGLSDVGLRKTCHRHNIPTPPAGFWSKKQHGKAGPPPELPLEYDQKTDVIRFDPPPTTDGTGQPEDCIPQHPDVAQALEREKAAPQIEVGEFLANTPEAVANTYRALKSAKPSVHSESYGRVETSSHSGECLDVSIGPNGIMRSMRFLSALIRALEARGFKLVHKDQGYDKGIRLVILGEELSFRVFEPARRKQHILTAEEREHKKRYPNSSWHKKWDFEPCGQLEFTVSGRSFYCRSQTWRDTSKRALESTVNDVIMSMLWMVDELKTRREAHRRAEEARAEAERRRREAEERRRKEEVRVKALLDEVESWERSGRIRRYLSAVENFAVSKHGRIDSGSELDVWLKWAVRAADRIDPLFETKET